MLVKEKIKSFLKPNIAKIIVSMFVVIYVFYLLSTVFPFLGLVRAPSLLAGLLFLPLMFTGVFQFILIFPYAYLIACVFVSLFNGLKQSKFFLVLAAVIFIILLGIDEPLINNTVNRPDYSCSVNSDCVQESISKDWCGNYQCLNKNWKYYKAMLGGAFALSCERPFLSCTCVKNKCKSTDLRKSTNLEDCEKLKEDSLKKWCIELVSHNVKTLKD